MSVVLSQPVQVALTTTSEEILAQNSRRSYLRVKNRGGDSVLIKVDEIHAADEGLLLQANETWEPKAVPINSIWAKAESATATVDVTEG